MGDLSLAHWLVVLVVIVVLFGRGRISETMGDFGKGLREFRNGMANPDKLDPAPAQEAIARSPATSQAPDPRMEQN